jgi:hypothetical protein
MTRCAAKNLTKASGEAAIHSHADGYGVRIRVEYGTADRAGAPADHGVWGRGVNGRTAPARCSGRRRMLRRRPAILDQLEQRGLLGLPRGVNASLKLPENQRFEIVES